MIVWVDVLVLALLVAEMLEREVRDHLVRVHVGRSPGAALDEVGDELVKQFAGNQSVTGSHDRLGDPGVEYAEIAVGHRGSLLHISECLDKIRLHGHRKAGDVEVLLSPERLDTVIDTVGKFFGAEEIFFHPCGHGVAPMPQLPPTDNP